MCFWYSVLGVFSSERPYCTAIFGAYRPWYGTIAVKVLQNGAQFCVGKVKFVKELKNEGENTKEKEDITAKLRGVEDAAPYNEGNREGQGRAQPSPFTGRAEQSPAPTVQ